MRIFYAYPFIQIPHRAPFRHSDSRFAILYLGIISKAIWNIYEWSNWCINWTIFLWPRFFSFFRGKRKKKFQQTNNNIQQQNKTICWSLPKRNTKWEVETKEKSLAIMHIRQSAQSISQKKKIWFEKLNRNGQWLRVTRGELVGYSRSFHAS